MKNYNTFFENFENFVKYNSKKNPRFKEMLTNKFDEL
jgi:hypothetical protein